MLNRIILFSPLFFAMFLVISVKVYALEETVDAKKLRIQVSYTTSTGRKLKTLTNSHIVDEGPDFVLDQQQWDYIRKKLKATKSVKMERVPGGKQLKGVTFKSGYLFTVRHPIINLGEKATVNLNSILSQQK